MSDRVKNPDDLRWGGEINKLFTSLGCELAECEGVSDYQGWGVMLFKFKKYDWRDEHEWLVVSWGYGSCGGCDAYEDNSPFENAKAWLSLAEHFRDEGVARKAYTDATERGW